jgi:biotin carboxyl carrier protein
MIEEEDKMAVDIVAHMPGTISMIMVNVGDKVQADDELLVLEAMKMENPICAKTDGTVIEIKVKENDKVAINQVLMVLE